MLAATLPAAHCDNPASLAAVPLAVRNMGATRGVREHRHVVVRFVETMQCWTPGFSQFAVLAGYIGFAALAGAATGIAKLLFVTFPAPLVSGFMIRDFSRIMVM